MKGKARLGFPVLVAVVRFLGVVVAQRVDANAGRIDEEFERRLAVAARPERDRDPIRFDETPATREPLHDASACLLAVESDVDGFVVVQDAERGALGRCLPFVRELLHEGRRRLGLRPRRVVELAVEHRRIGHTGRREVRPCLESGEQEGPEHRRDETSMAGGKFIRSFRWAA